MQININQEVKQKVNDIISINGFVPTLCHSLASIAYSDGPITLNEYSLIVSTANQISKLSDNPTLINIFTLQGILSETKLDIALNKLNQIQHNISPENTKIILNALLPLISVQRDSGKILETFTILLDGTKNTFIRYQLFSKNFRMKLPTKYRLIKKQLGDFLPFFQQLSTIEAFALRFHDDLLIEYLKTYQSETSEKNLELLTKQLETSKQHVIESVKSFKQQMSLMCEQNSSADQLTLLAETLYNQVEQRLIEIQKRADLQKSMFKEDLDEFVTQSVNELELNLRKKLEVKDWTNKKVWEDIAKSEPAKALTDHYDKLKIRYEKIFNLWNDEFNHFSNELSLTQKVILQGLEKQELSQLIQPPVPRLKALEKLDKASSLIVNTLKMAGAGSFTLSGIAIATGVPASIFLVSATTIGSFIISSPLGWLAICTIFLAGLYQYFSNPMLRRGKEIKNKRSLIEDALKKMIGYPEETHNQHIDYIVENFRKTAVKNFTPLLQDTRLAVKMNEMRKEVINKITHATLKELDELHIN